MNLHRTTKFHKLRVLSGRETDQWHRGAAHPDRIHLPEVRKMFLPHLLSQVEGWNLNRKRN